MGMPGLISMADELISLKPSLVKSKLEDVYVIKTEDFRNNSKLVCAAIKNKFVGRKVAIKATKRAVKNIIFSYEDKRNVVTDVNSANEKDLNDAINKIIAYYEELKNMSETVLDEYIVIQKQTENIILSGVVFTRDIMYNIPYYMVSYENIDDTRNEFKRSKSKIIAKNSSREFLDDGFMQLYFALKEIDEIYKDIDVLEIEFGIDSNCNVSIFRIMPFDSRSLGQSIMSDREFVDTKAFAKCTYLDTNHMLTDVLLWNPAEILGNNPRPLDYSLFKYILSSRIWTESISVFGYDKVDGALIQKIGNRPYISIDNVIKSLFPASLDKFLKFKIEEYYKNWIRNNRHLHGQEESMILLSTYDLSSDRKLESMREYGFTDEEIDVIKNTHFELTNNVLKMYKQVRKEDVKSLNELTRIRYDIRKKTPLAETNVMKLYSYVKELVDSIREYGTPQYSRQKRNSCVANDICRSIVEAGYIDKNDMKAFLHAIPTISSRFNKNFEMYRNGRITREEFDSVYGHVRLGVYDIRSDCYRNKFFDISNYPTPSVLDYIESPSVSLDTNKLQKAIDKVGYDITAEDLIDFISSSISNKEAFKFEYTKTVSLILEIIARLGELQMIAREDMSYLKIQELMDYHSRDSYIQIIEGRRNMYYAYSYLSLPDTIFTVGDIDSIDYNDVEPYYVTNSIVEADVVNLDEKSDANIEDKLVVLSRADQGYEWIFTKNVAGIIIKYGKENSYIAKRCLEYGVPAIIGCGEKIFKKIGFMSKAKLDCMNKTIEKIV